MPAEKLFFDPMSIDEIVVETLPMAEAPEGAGLRIDIKCDARDENEIEHGRIMAGLGILVAENSLPPVDRSRVEAWYPPLVALETVVVVRIPQPDHVHDPRRKASGRRRVRVEIGDVNLLPGAKGMPYNGIGLNLPSRHGEEDADALGFYIGPKGL